MAKYVYHNKHDSTRDRTGASLDHFYVGGEHNFIFHLIPCYTIRSNNYYKLY